MNSDAYMVPTPSPPNYFTCMLDSQSERERDSEKTINTGSSEKVQLEIIYIPYHGDQKFFLPSKCVQKEMEQI